MIGYIWYELLLLEISATHTKGLDLTIDFPCIQAVRKASLTPYLYSLAFQAYLTGEPPVRAMELEFPHEIWSNKYALQYQFMSGPQRKDAMFHCCWPCCHDFRREIPKVRAILPGCTSLPERDPSWPHSSGKWRMDRLLRRLHEILGTKAGPNCTWITCATWCIWCLEDERKGV